MAARLVELSVQVREVLRGPLDIATAVSSDDSDIEPSRPVEVPCPPQSFADPAPTQAAPAEHEQPGEDLADVAASVENVEHTPVPVPHGAFVQPEGGEEAGQMRWRAAKAVLGCAYYVKLVWARFLLPGCWL